MHVPKALLVPFGALVVLAGCGSPSAHDRLAPAEQLSDLVLQQEVRVQEAYRFALANPHHLETIPCYCGCAGLGHRNNLDCYLAPESTPEQPVFDDHALACGVCVDITHDVMEMLDTTDKPDVIRYFIDSQYGEVGPGTDTPHPQAAHGS
jgi:hypothetical protein